MTQPGLAPPPAWGPPEAPRPGCVPLRPLGLGDIVDGSISMIRRNPRVMLGLSAAVAAIQVLLVAGLELLTFSSLGDVAVTGTGNPTANTDVGTAVFLITLGVSLVLGSVLTGMLTIAITQDVIGVRLGVGDVWRRVRPRIWRLLGLVLITSVVPVLGLALCLAPGIWLWGMWAVAVPALMAEGTTVRGALGRSWLLVRGSFWRVWGIRALGVLISSIVGQFLALPFVLVGTIVDSDVLGGDTTRLPVVYLVMTALGTAVSATFTAPVRAGIDALLYVDQRMRREGLDIVLQLPPRPVSAPAAPPTGFTAF